MSDNDDLRDKFKKPLLRPAMNLPAKRTDAPEPPPAAGDEAHPGIGGLARLLQAVARMLTPKPPPPKEQPQAAAEPPAFTVLVAALAGDADGQGAANLVRIVEARSIFKVKTLGRSFALDTIEDPAAVAAATTNTRHAVAAENADLLIWGDVGREGYRLRLATAGSIDDDRPGSFGATTRIELPLEPAEAVCNLFHAAVLAAADAASETQKGVVRRLLPAAATQAEALAAKPPIQMTMGQQRSTQLVFGHVAAATALAVPPSQAQAWFDKAVNSYRAAQRRVGRTEPGWETGLLHKHIAAVLTVSAERSKEPGPILAEAVKEWRAATETLVQGTMPQEWVVAQCRLGKALYRLDLVTGDTELLREALTVLQAALQVYSRTETPQKWADVMHDIAQVLEVYGDQRKSPEVLRRSIETCESVLQVVTRERTPLSWAAAQNTLGSALFLLDRHSDGTSHLEDAAAALQAALEIFRASGAKGPAQVAQRNLAHVRKLTEDRRGRQVIHPDWADAKPKPPARRR